LEKTPRDCGRGEKPKPLAASQSGMIDGTVMEFLKHVGINLAVLVILVAVLLPVGLAEGKLGNGLFAGMLLVLSIVMTAITSLVCGLGTRAVVTVKCVSAVIALWFLVSMVMFLVIEKPDICGDVGKYWIGAAISAGVIVLQLMYNRQKLGMLFRSKERWIHSRHQWLPGQNYLHAYRFPFGWPTLWLR